MMYSQEEKFALSLLLEITESKGSLYLPTPIYPPYLPSINSHLNQPKLSASLYKFALKLANLNSSEHLLLYGNLLWKMDTSLENYMNQ